jgi:opacity protein-like surface antigen
MNLRPAVPFVALALVLSLAPAGAAAGSIGVEAQGGYHSLAAGDSAQAVFDGSSGGGTFGGAVRYVLGNGFYVAAGARTFSREGERVFVAGPTAPVARLGFPLEVRITPILGTVGYRFRNGRAFVPYAGVGGGVTRFRETSAVAGDVREDRRRKGSFHAIFGLEYGRGTVRLGAEGLYSSVPDGIGVGGVSKVFKEDDLGGFSAIGKLVVAFGR